MKNYICPELEYVMLSNEDVIATSISIVENAGNPNSTIFGGSDWE